MKPIFALTALIFCFSFAARAQETVPLITVTGQAEIRVAPDEVLIFWGVETSDKVLRTAKTENDERVNRVITLTRNLGIETKHIQTDFIGVEPWYRERVATPENLEYRVRKSIVVTLKDMTKFETLVSQGLEAGITHIHEIHFRTTELRKHRDSARALAIKAAREKATALASELGQKIGQAHRINEHGSGWYSPYGSGWGRRWSTGMTQNVIQDSGGSIEGGGTFAPGQITVTANVSISFVLE